MAKPSLAEEQKKLLSIIEHSIDDQVGVLEFKKKKFGVSAIEPSGGLAAAAAIVGIASGVAGIFSSARAKKDRKEILARLKEVKKQLTNIDKKIDLVTKRLVDISVRLEQLPVEAAQRELTARTEVLYSQINRWLKMNKKQIGESDLVEFVLQHQQDIFRLTLLGYAHYLLLAKSMLENMGLLNHLGYSPDEKKDTAKKYINFLNECKATTGIEGNIGSQIPPLQRQIDLFIDQAAGIDRKGRLRTESNTTSEANGTWVSSTIIYGFIDGDLNNGFKISDREERGPTHHGWYPKCPGCKPHGGDLGPIKVMNSDGEVDSVTDPGFIFLGEPNYIDVNILLRNLNSVRASYLSSVAALKLINEDVAAIDATIKSIKALAAKK